jgi:hypothetical protein
VHRGSQRKVQRPKTQDRKDVRRVYDERIQRDREYRGNRIDREDQINELDKDQCKPQGGQPAHHLARFGMGVFYGEIVAFDFACDAEMFAGKFQHRVVFQITMLVARCEHLDPSHDQECAKQIQNPLVLRDQSRAQTDHDGAHDDCAQNAPKQDAMLIGARHVKIGKNRRDNKDIVHGERLLNHIARVKLKTRLRAARVPDPCAKGQGDADIATIKHETFARRDFFVGLV